MERLKDARPLLAHRFVSQDTGMNSVFTLRRSLPAGHIAFPSLTMQRALIAQARGEAQSALNLADQAVAAVEASLKEGREGADYLAKFSSLAFSHPAAGRSPGSGSE